MILDLLGYGAFFLSTALIFGLITLGLNLQWGLTGLFNVGIAGFVAIGAYASAILTSPDVADRIGGFGWPIWAGWLAAMLIAGAAAAFTGYATLRLKADYLAITTFGVAVVVQLVALNAQGLTGGPFGVAFIPRPFAGVQDQPVLFNFANLGVVVAVTLATFLALQRLSASPWGRVLRALREDERAAIALGKNARAYRIQAFAVGGAIMGLAGAVQAHFIGFIAPDNYLPILTFQVWAMLMVGGSGSNWGALLGAITVWAIWVASGTLTASLVPGDWQARAASLQIVAIGVMLCLILLWRPQGFFGPRKRRT
ncbi:branched-chain amino acid ABC transporter permease [Tabrizicola sp.]|uniref:branched-chain amino acid ABC transporter permease n=1 Tax=Tabrizicola sp. TaxID=2005166 RepID=UPI0035B2E1F1